MFNDSTQQIALSFKYHVKLFKSDFISQFLKYREDFFRALQMQMPILQFPLKYPNIQKLHGLMFGE
jgi:hypothetical protein